MTHPRFAGYFDGTEGGPAGFRELAERALELRGGAAPDRADGLRLVAMFFNPSLRTRTSLECAAENLGIRTIILNPGSDAWKLEHRDGVVMNEDKAEHLADAVPILGEYADLLAVRTFAGLTDLEEDRRDAVLSAFVKHSSRPVINLESARWHPLQGLADAATLFDQLGTDLRGLPVTLTWAPHPRALPAAVPNQFLLTAALLGLDLTVAHPEGFDLDPEVIAKAEGVGAETGASLRFSHDQGAAMRGARVVMAKSWSGFSGYGRREDEARVRASLGSWTVDARKMALTDDAGFMHCLPVRRNVVVTDEVIDGPRSWTTITGGLRLASAEALLERIVAAKGEHPWNV